MTNKLETYISEIEQLLIYKEYSQLVKRLIDLTLDTEDIKYYKTMLDHLDWLDYSSKLEAEEVHERYNALFLLLKDALMSKNRKLERL